MAMPASATEFQRHRIQNAVARFTVIKTTPPAGCLQPYPMASARWRIIVRDHAKDREILSDLNRNYVRSVDEADAAWFDANLASDFLNTNADGTLIDRSAFIAQIGRGSSVKNIREHDVIIRIFGDFA